MCLAVPGKIIKINKDIATVDFGGVETKVGLHLVDSPKVGDWVISHAGMAIHKMTECEARKVFRAFEGKV
ncbi:MAG: Hydrogenase expression/formation protein HypC [candidate division CPR2 bacterium GW2011_GWC1_39_9]|uniref:Hydrogenase expression/formation protein HypC n=1 Tax=candidate division CPR2 bacterium GW2011_GWC2_39_10 TaxID=1618345 RepID=A0A0G0M1K0_UNCC2|nr:MAG: Hydrogenase expression/formation protein HypC [candidate division CPR2 bacterium GW2011_GWC2_39_10]KKR35030.1 MAG: Hydrogenase expression/formation protein HypC [candidate division CPR2 bacterium GW2011_GWC1_39_9]